ncbi:MAG: NUDIX domain-containing protein [Acidobacteria bacterium]|nr:NUDIX domain-containing protein [Acidobacteriota bacterium]
MSPETSWDGKPIASEPPFGCTVVVYRRKGPGWEFLLLHRAHNGPQDEGDWAWTPPAGSRQPGESPDECAVRELSEEAGVSAQVRATEHGSPEWVVFRAEAGTGVEVILHDSEHDRFEWVRLDDALRKCSPPPVARAIALVAGDLA